MASRNRFVAKPVSFELLFLELRGPLNGLWFECFHALKVDKTKLLQIRDKYRKDPKICVIEGIRAWLENTDPPPSWESLVPVLRYVLLETELADRIERLYVDPSKYPNYQPRMPTFSTSNPKITYEGVKSSFGPPGFSNTAFSSLLTDMMDQYNDGGSCYTLHYAISSLCCPDGTPYIDSEIIRSTMSIDGIVMSLLFHNYVSDMDIDLIIYLMKVLQHFDAISFSLQIYYKERSLIQPFVRKILNIDTIFLITFEFQREVTVADFELATNLKERVQIICNLTSFPYIMQFMGWSVGPLCLYYQLPYATMHLVRKSFQTMPESLKELKISKVNIEVGSAKDTLVTQ